MTQEGLVLICTAQGAIQSILLDSTGWLCTTPDTLLSIVDPHTIDNAREFLNLASEGTALSWDLRLAIENRSETWTFHGVSTPQGILVVGVPSKETNLAVIDPLTGLFNRLGWSELGQREVARSRRCKHSLSVLMIDIDHFKRINDTYGHATGDEVLRQLATLIRANVREIDIVGRYGGEEFIVFLPETEIGKAALVGRKLRQLVEETSILVKLQPIHITVSVGVAELEPLTTLERLIEMADKVMYSAKESGRNCVRMY